MLDEFELHIQKFWTDLHNAQYALDKGLLKNTEFYLWAANSELLLIQAMLHITCD
jgi:hypothetical protein